MYWENPIHKNIVNPIPIPNTIAQACVSTIHSWLIRQVSISRVGILDEGSISTVGSLAKEGHYAR